MDDDRGDIIDVETNSSMIWSKLEYYSIAILLFFTFWYIIYSIIFDYSQRSGFNDAEFLLFVVILGTLIGTWYHMYRRYKCRTRVKIYQNGFVPDFALYSIAKNNKDVFIKWTEVKKYRRIDYNLFKQKRWWYNINLSDYSVYSIGSGQFDNSEKVLCFIDNLSNNVSATTPK